MTLNTLTAGRRDNPLFSDEVRQYMAICYIFRIPAATKYLNLIWIMETDNFGVPEIIIMDVGVGVL